MMKGEVRMRLGWDWSGLAKHVEELLRDIELTGEAVDDLYVVWSLYGPTKVNNQFKMKTVKALKRVFKMKGIEVKILWGRNGRIRVVRK